jgi:predicted component of type VI protein secretion system
MPPTLDTDERDPQPAGAGRGGLPGRDGGGGLPVMRELPVVAPAVARVAADTSEDNDNDRDNDNDGSGWPTLDGLAQGLLRILASGTGARWADLAGELQVAIDRVVGQQLALVMDHPSFRRLEATWRGIAHLRDVQLQFPSESCHVSILDYGPHDLLQDLGSHQKDWKKSWLYGELYDRTFDQAGGDAFGLLVSGMEFGKPAGTDEFDREGLLLLERLSLIAERVLCPFVAGASPSLLGERDFADLPGEREITFHPLDRDQAEAWAAFRDSRGSRFVALVAPRVVLREPLSRLDGCGDWFGWALRTHPDVTAACHRPVLGSGSFAVGGLVIRSMQAGWPSDIQGVRLADDGASDTSSMFAAASFSAPDGAAATPSVTADGRAVLLEDGGGVVLLPGESFRADPPGVIVRPPLEVSLTGAQERRLGQLGLMTVARVPHTAHAAFYSLRMFRNPRRADGTGMDPGTEELHSLLPYMLTAARFAHWVKRWGRVKHGGTRTARELEAELQDMLGHYRGPGMQLRDAQVTVTEDGVGNFDCTLSISPRLAAEDVEVVGNIALEVRVVNAPLGGTPSAGGGGDAGETVDLG